MRGPGASDPGAEDGGPDHRPRTPDAAPGPTSPGGPKVPAGRSVVPREQTALPPSVGTAPAAYPGKVLVPRTAVLLVVALVVTAVGLVDVLRDGASDLTVVFAGLLLLQVAALATTLPGSRAVRLRPDLTAWLDRQAAATGEPVERLADRCVAAYRAGLTGDRQGIP